VAVPEKCRVHASFRSQIPLFFMSALSWLLCVTRPLLWTLFPYELAIPCYLMLSKIFKHDILLFLEKENGPRTVKDVKLISAGKILENNRTLGECQSPLCDIPGGVTTMHVVVQQPSSEKGKAFLRHSKNNFWSLECKTHYSFAS
jgi:hypothetical protein